MDPITRNHVTRSLASDHERLVAEAETIAKGWSAYVDALRRDPESNTSSEPVRLAEYTARFIRAASRLDAAREMARVLMDDGS
jgi:hypothetical protein